MKTKSLIAASFACLLFINSKAQTLFVPSGTTGISSSTVSNSVGINTSSPKAYFHVNSPTGLTEANFFRATVSGAPNDFFTIFNGRNTADHFVPALWGHTQSYLNRGMLLIGSTSSTHDVSHGIPLIDISARQWDGTKASAVVNRHLFQVNNLTTPAFTITAKGAVGIGKANPTGNLNVYGTENPLLRLESPISSFHMAIATCNTCYANQAVTGDAVLYNWGGNMIIKNAQAGKSIKFLTKIAGQTWDLQAMAINDKGQVGIGMDPCMPSDGLLGVNGAIYSRAVKVRVPANSCFPDYVFEQGYKLKPLSEVDEYIKKNKHLPGFPTAGEVEEKGMDVGELQIKLVEKVEELTLHLIDMKKKMDMLEAENKALNEKLNGLGK